MIIEMQKYIEAVLFSYSTEHLAKKDKVRFFYALNGRDSKSGILKETNARHIGRAVLLVNKDKENEMTDFLNYWKCGFMARNVLVKKIQT